MEILALELKHKSPIIRKS